MRSRLGSHALLAILLSGMASVPLVGQTPFDEEEPWPRTRSTNGHRIVIHVPQVETWTSTSLLARAAVEVRLAHTKKESLGVVWFAAPGSVDHSNRIVTLDKLQISKARFPDAPNQATEIRELLNSLLPKGARTISVDYLLTTLGLAQAAVRQGKGGYRHEPPQIIWATNRAALIIIDGEPVLRSISGTSLQRIVNTPAVLVFDNETRKFFLEGNGQWFQSEELKGAWKPSLQPPPAVVGLSQAKAGESVEPEQELIRQIFISTRPAELLATAGMPDFRKIPDTALRYAADTDNQLFFYDPDRQAYLLLSGRWFRADSLKGPWTYVTPHDLPSDFGKIPLTHPKALVLGSVPNTPQAEMASIATTMPTTATVSRREASIRLRYDGEPRFKPIDGTKLLYAANADLPVIRAGDAFYALDRGVWFVASGASGPWSVTSEVPEEIYSIPPSSPVYYATFARVFEADEDAVEVGYTSGYLGAYENEGTVVYGTGWDYEPWVGDEYYGWGWTWGYTYVYNPWLQWWLWREWWNQPGGLWAGVIDNVYWRWQNRNQVTPHEAANGSPWNTQFSGYPALYGRFASGSSTRFSSPENTLALNPYTRFETPARAGVVPRGAEMLRTLQQNPTRGRDLYASPDGGVYQRRENGWYRREAGGSWSFAAPAPGRIERVNLAPGQVRSNPNDGAGRMASVNVIRGGSHPNRVPELASGPGPEAVRSIERDYYARALYEMRQQGWNQRVNRPRAGRVGGRRR